MRCALICQELTTASPRSAHFQSNVPTYKDFINFWFSDFSLPFITNLLNTIYDYLMLSIRQDDEFSELLICFMLSYVQKCFLGC